VSGAITDYHCGILDDELGILDDELVAFGVARGGGLREGQSVAHGGSGTSVGAFTLGPSIAVVVKARARVRVGSGQCEGYGNDELEHL
jgi:hypothetical protein